MCLSVPVHVPGAVFGQATLIYDRSVTACAVLCRGEQSSVFIGEGGGWGGIVPIISIFGSIRLPLVFWERPLITS